MAAALLRDAITNSEDNPAFVGNLVKEGTGTITLAGSNTYSGNTTVSDGALEIASTGSLRFRPTTNGANNSVVRFRPPRRCPSSAP